MLKAKILFVGPCEVRPGPGTASGRGAGALPGLCSAPGPPRRREPSPTAPNCVCAAGLTGNSKPPDLDPVSLRPKDPR